MCDGKAKNKDLKMSNKEELLLRGQFLINRGNSLIKFQKMWPGNLMEGQKLLKAGTELLAKAKDLKVGPPMNKIKDLNKEVEKHDTCDASNDVNDDVENENDVQVDVVKNLGDKTENRAVQ